MSGGPAVVDSLAECEKRFGWPTEPFNLLDSLSLLPNWPWQGMAPSSAVLGSRLHAVEKLLSATRPPWDKQFLGLRAATQAASRLRRLLAFLSGSELCTRLCEFAMLLLHYLPLDWLSSPAAG